MNVRKATPSDLDVLVEFTAEEAREAEGNVDVLNSLSKGIGVALENESIAIYWILENDNGAPVGHISAVKEWSNWNAGYYWWIQSLYIAPDHRGKGFLSLLIDTVNMEMEQENGLELRLYAHGKNEIALRAYEKVGFHRSDYQIMILKK